MRKLLIPFLGLIAGFAPLAGETFLSLKVSNPLMVSGSGGIYLSAPPAGGESAFRPVLEGEVGIGGGRILVGIDSINEGFGFGLKAAVLRTWLEPIDVKEDNTYLGVELEGAYGRFVVAIGGYRHTSGDEDDEWLGTLSLGIRF